MPELHPADLELQRINHLLAEEVMGWFRMPRFNPLTGPDGPVWDVWCSAERVSNPDGSERSHVSHTIEVDHFLVENTSLGADEWWHPTTCIKQAFEVLEELQDDWYWILGTDRDLPLGSPYMCVLHRKSLPLSFHKVSSISPAHAICLAALAAYGVPPC